MLQILGVGPKKGGNCPLEFLTPKIKKNSIDFQFLNHMKGNLWISVRLQNFRKIYLGNFSNFFCQIWGHPIPNSKRYLTTDFVLLGEPYRTVLEWRRSASRKLGIGFSFRPLAVERRTVADKEIRQAYNSIVNFSTWNLVEVTWSAAFSCSRLLKSNTRAHAC